jgi:putative transposase
VRDCFSTYERGWHISPACAGADAIEAVKLAIAGAGRLGGAPLPRLLPARPGGTPVRIKLVTGNGPAFKGAAFAQFIASRPELARIRTRARSPGQNGVRERAFGSLKYEHLYRHAEQTATLADLYREAEAYRKIFNEIRPHEAPGMRRPIEIIRDPSLHPIHKNQTEDLVPEA